MLRKIYIVMLCLHRQTDIRMLLQLRPELLQITLIHNVSRRRILIHERTIPPFARQPPVHIEPSQIGDRGYLYPSIASCCHFIGNAEARELPQGGFDVVVADGFAGNMILKLYEGMGGMFRDKLKDWFSGVGKLAALLILGKIKDFRKQMDYKEEGGGIILGVASPVIKAHGSSDAKAFFNAIRQAKKCVDGHMIDEIARTVAEMKEDV